MPYIGRPQSSGSFAKLDDVSSQFNNSKTIFDLKIGGESFFPGNPYTLLVSLGCLLYTSPSPRDLAVSRMPSAA